MVTVWQFEYAFPDGAKWAESHRYWKVYHNELCHVRTQLIIYSSADLACTASYIQMDLYEKYTKEFIVIGLSCYFPTVDIFIVWLLQNALPIALFQLQLRKKKYQMVLHLTHDRNAITFEAFQQPFVNNARI